MIFFSCLIFTHRQTHLRLILKITFKFMGRVGKMRCKLYIYYNFKFIGREKHPLTTLSCICIPPGGPHLVPNSLVLFPCHLFFLVSCRCLCCHNLVLPNTSRFHDLEFLPLLVSVPLPPGFFPMKLVAKHSLSTVGSLASVWIRFLSPLRHTPCRECVRILLTLSVPLQQT